MWPSRPSMLLFSNTAQNGSVHKFWRQIMINLVSEDFPLFVYLLPEMNFAFTPLFRVK